MIECVYVFVNVLGWVSVSRCVSICEQVLVQGLWVCVRGGECVLVCWCVLMYEKGLG